MMGFDAETSAAALQTGMKPEKTEYASDEEQAVYNAFVNAARIMVFAKKSRDSVVAMLAGETPDEKVQGMAEATSAIATRAAQEIAKQRKQPLSSEIVIQGMDEIMSAIKELAQSRNAYDLTSEQEQAAMYAALSQAQHGMRQAGVLDEAEANADFEALKGMSEADIMARFGQEVA